MGQYRSKPKLLNTQKRFEPIFNDTKKITNKQKKKAIIQFKALKIREIEKRN